MAHEYGMAVKSVSIVEDEETLGRAYRDLERWLGEIGYDVTPYREIKVHKHIMVCLAGAAATAIYASYATWRGADRDLQFATGFADHLTSGPEESEALLKWLWIRTRKTLGVPWTWAKVEAIANALLAQEELTGQQFRRLLDDAQAQVLAEQRDALGSMATPDGTQA